MLRLARSTPIAVVGPIILLMWLTVSSLAQQPIVPNQMTKLDAGSLAFDQTAESIKTPDAGHQSTSSSSKVLQVLPAEYRHRIPESFTQQLKFMSPDRARIISRALGLSGSESAAKVPMPPAQTSTSGIASNIPIATRQRFSEISPSIAIDPSNPNRMIAGLVQFDISDFDHTVDSCVAYSSNDGGQTWNGPISMPLLEQDGSKCADPVVAYTPDGSRVYFAYARVRAGMDDNLFAIVQSSDILVSYSDDGGVTWTGPVIALKGETTIWDCFGMIGTSVFGFDVDTPSITAANDYDRSKTVYLSATKYPFTEWPATGSLGHAGIQNYQIVFTRSLAGGKVDTWEESQPIEITPDREDPNLSSTIVAVGGAKVVATGAEGVLVAWYNSNGPGIETGIGPTPPDDSVGIFSNSFLIRTRYSSDHGATFGPIVNAVVEEYEPYEWMGPDTVNQRWVPARYPDLAIAANGSAHIVYTAGLNNDPYGIENGDVHYIASSGAPYETWSSPETVNDDGLQRAQGLASVEAVGSNLYVTFLDTRFSPDAAPNSIYDVFGATKAIGDSGWENFRVTDGSAPETVVQQYTSQRFDLAAADSVVYAVWTDRQHLDSYVDPNADVYGQAYRPIASVNSVSPSSVSAGSSPITLTLEGSSFGLHSVVRLDGADIATTFVNSTHISAQVPSSYLASGGAHNLTVYTPGAPASATSQQLPLNITDFSLGAWTTSVAVKAGQTANYTITVSPVSGIFDRTVTLSCSGLPQSASCSFAPASLVPNGEPVTTTLSIMTTAPKTATVVVPISGDRSVPVFAFLVPGLGILVSGFNWRTKDARHRRLVLLLLLLLVGLSMLGCGSNSVAAPQTTPVAGTAAGDYSVTVTAVSGSVSHSQTVILKVQ